MSAVFFTHKKTSRKQILLLTAGGLYIHTLNFL